MPRGTTAIHKLLDADGRTFTWFGKEMNIDGIKPGATFTATWSIKAHNTFREWKETVINRPSKIAVLEDD